MFKYLYKNNLNSNEAFIYIYFPLKLFTVLFIVAALKILDPNYNILAFTDGSYYFNCDQTTVNFLFAFSSCLLEINNTFSVKAILLVFSLSCLRDLIYLKIAKRYLSFNSGLIFFAIFLACHPYSAIYSVKYTTDIYGSLGILLLTYQVAFNKNNLFLFILGLILILFRNNLITVFSIFYLFLMLIEVNKFGLKKVKVYIFYLITLIIIGLSFSNSTYTNEKTYLYLLLSKDFPFSFTNHLELINFGNLFFQYLLATISHIISHMILLTGFRESVYIFGFSSLFGSGNFYGYMQLSFSLLISMVNILGLIYFFKINSNRLIYSVVFYIFPTFLILSHLRYFYPLIPLAMLGLSFYISKLVNNLNN